MILRILVNTSNININNQTVRVVRVYNRNVPSGITEVEFTQKGGILVGTGSGTFIEQAPGANGTFLKYDSTQPGGVTAAIPTITIDDTTNHLLNGGFDFAQRQTPGTLTTITDEKYGPDRWRMTRENADLQYIRVDGSSESGLTSPYFGQFKKITNAGKILIFQPLEYLDTLKFRGKTVNFQLQMKASAAKTIKIAIVELATGGTADTLPAATVSAWAADGTDPTLGANYATIGTPTTCSVTTAWQTFQFTGAFPASSKNLLVMVWSNADFAANDTLSLAEAGLYFGSSLRGWTPRSYGQELHLCQRYYYLHASGNTKHISMAAAYTATNAQGEVKFPATMRTTPVLDATSGVGYYTFYRNGSNDTFDSLTIDLQHENGCSIYNATEISGTAGHAGEFSTKNASARVGFNAELT